MKIEKTLAAVHVISYHNFDNFAKDHYGHDLEIVAVEEWYNDSHHLYTNITAEDKLKWTKWDMQEWAEFTGSGIAPYGITRMILEDLVAEGILEPGNYMIEVFW